ncbi:MAG: HlyD family efflux transporter periplasmic adaptor subunit [Filomicrobium sp.]
MAVTIKRERPDQRRHHRLTAPLFVEVGGHRVRAYDWSLGGLRIESFPGKLPTVGSELEVSLALPFQGFDVAFKVIGEVVRVDPSKGLFAIQYTQIGERESELMAHFIEDLVRGHMTDVEDTIQRIDVPVTPASLKPDEQPASKPANQPKPDAIKPGDSKIEQLEKLPVRRWPVKTVAMSAFYILLGFIIFSYAGILAYSNFFRIEVPTAVISAPVDMVEAQVDGQVEWTSLKPGDSVKSGDVLLKLLDNKLEREIELADIAVKSQKAKLIYLKRRHAEELDRIKSFAAIEMKNVKQARIAMESTKASLALARDQHRRLNTLYEKGFTTLSRLDDAREKVVTLEKQLASQRLELSTRADLADGNIGKRLYTGDDLIGKSEELAAEVRLAEHEIALAQQRHLAAVRERDNLAVRAPFDGTILKLPRVDRSSVRRGDVIAVVEERRKRHVTAFLNQDEIAKVGIGDEALLYVPALGETLKGHISAIDRTSGFLREQERRQNPGYTWRGPTDRSAQVTINFDDPNTISNFKKYRSGLPVVVIFEKRTQNSILSSLAQKLQLAL